MIITRLNNLTQVSNRLIYIFLFAILHSIHDVLLLFAMG